jgi:hypothetical protein
MNDTKIPIIELKERERLWLDEVYKCFKENRQASNGRKCSALAGHLCLTAQAVFNRSIMQPT